MNHPARRLLQCLLALALCGPGATPVQAQAAQPVPEYKLKAAFVYNFALFTDWPADALGEGAAFNICVNPDSALRTELADIERKRIKGHRVVVGPVSDAGLRNCHLLLLDSLDRERWPQIRKILGDASVLTVSDDDEISGDGAMIGLRLDNKRISFDIDAKAARQAGLALSSKLLRLARSVQ